MKSSRERNHEMFAYWILRLSRDYSMGPIISIMFLDSLDAGHFAGIPLPYLYPSRAGNLRCSSLRNASDLLDRSPYRNKSSRFIRLLGI